MRRTFLVLLLIALSGCGRARPTMAGGKWAAALRDPDAQVRKKAAFTLGNIGSSDPTVLPALREALQDADPAVRREAILALLKYGPGAGETLPELAALRQRDRDPWVRDYAARALEALRREK
jgi:HEAT repeat protein